MCTTLTIPRRTRRKNGEGTIYQRKDGRWVAQFTTLGGKRESLYGRTREEIAELLAYELGEVERLRKQRGRVRPTRRGATGDYLEQWLEDIARPNVRPTTLRTYRSFTQHYLIPRLGQIPLSDLRPQDIQGMISDLVCEGMKPQTVREIRNILKTALSNAMRWDLIQRNPAALTDPPRYEGKEITPISPDDARALLAAFHHDRLRALYILALTCGLRRGELLGLQWADVDFANRTVAIRQQLQRIQSIPTLTQPKTRKSRRTLALPDIAFDALQGHRKRQTEEREAAGEFWYASQFVFTTSSGRPLGATAATTHLHIVLKRAGLPQRRLHDLRHGCATLLFAQGVALKAVSDALGHSHVRFTADVYTHLFPEIMRDVADRMDDVFREHPPNAP